MCVKPGQSCLHWANNSNWNKWDILLFWCFVLFCFVLVFCFLMFSICHPCGVTGFKIHIITVVQQENMIPYWFPTLLQNTYSLLFCGYLTRIFKCAPHIVDTAFRLKIWMVTFNSHNVLKPCHTFNFLCYSCYLLILLNVYCITRHRSLHSNCAICCNFYEMQQEDTSVHVYLCNANENYDVLGVCTYNSRQQGNSHMFDACLLIYWFQVG